MLKLKKFLSDSKMFEYDRHYRECQQNNQPFIKGQKNLIDGNYLVQLDLITCNYNLTLSGLKKIEKLFTNETNYLQSIYPKKLIFKGCNIDKELVWYDGVLSTRLDSFCETLFNLSYIESK